MTTALMTFPCKRAAMGPKFDRSKLPLKRFAFREGKDIIAIVFVSESFCRWLAESMDKATKLVLYDELYLSGRRGFFVIDKDGWPVVECGAARVAEMICDLLNRQQPQIER